MNWHEFEAEIAALAAKIVEKPDIIVGVIRGGLVPARLLSSRLGVKDMYAVSVNKENNERRIMSEIKEDLNGKKVLLVEDMLEKGLSMQVWKEHLEAKGALVKTACLYTMPQTEVMPDYSLREVPEVQKFPWE